MQAVKPPEGLSRSRGSIPHACGTTQGMTQEYGPIPSIHHFPSSKTVGQWSKAMGWTSRPEATFTNVASAKAMFVNVRLSMPIYKSNLGYRHEEIYFLGCNYCRSGPTYTTKGESPDQRTTET